MQFNRRNFLKHSVSTAAGMTAAAMIPNDLFGGGLHSTSMPDEIIIKPTDRPKAKRFHPVLRDRDQPWPYLWDRG